MKHRVEPSGRFAQLQPKPRQVAGQVAQVPPLQLGVLPVPHVPHDGVLPPQPSGHVPQVFFRLEHVPGVQAQRPPWHD